MPPVNQPTSGYQQPYAQGGGQYPNAAPMPPQAPVSQPQFAQPYAPPQPAPVGAVPNQPTSASPQVVKTTNPNSTQNTLQIAEIRDGIVIMNDGSFRSVVMVKSINYDLMSQQEQEAVEQSYQGFLNSLYFPVQIFIRSQRIDLQPYVEKLERIRSTHNNMLLAMLMDDYIQYMAQLSQQTNIMDKRFYVVIPYYPHVEIQKAITQSKNFFTGLTGMLSSKEQQITINEESLAKAKTELKNRVQSVLGGLLQAGIQGLPLDTQELIELYYGVYNPDTATRQELKNFSGMTADIVTKGSGRAPQPQSGGFQYGA